MRRRKNGQGSRRKIRVGFFGSKREEKELYRRLRANIMVRRLKDDVLDLLPPIEETITLRLRSILESGNRGTESLLRAFIPNPLAKKRPRHRCTHCLRRLPWTKSNGRRNGLLLSWRIRTKDRDLLPLSTGRRSVAGHAA